ncbi:hypothetical protein ACFLW9_02755 [Chloroflexota bacterium]
MENLFARIGRMAFLLILGVCVVTYVALGIFYWQQEGKQRVLEEQIAKTAAIVSKPLPSTEKLYDEYDKVNISLTPLEISEALDKVVGIAEENGINVDPRSQMFIIPPPSPPGERKIGENTYQVLALRDIKVQGSHESVMAFISDLDTGKTLPTMVLEEVSISFVDVKYEGDEAARREEFRNISAAVIEMMADNALDEIPNPLSYDGDTATNYMGDDPDTENVTEGFPDIVTTVADKGYTGLDTPRDGYILYEHDRVSTDNTTQFESVDYIGMLTTQYYYTCEADGMVRQFDGPDLETATEYLGSEEYRTDTVATVSVNLYSKTLKEEEKKEK